MKTLYEVFCTVKCRIAEVDQRTIPVSLIYRRGVGHGKEFEGNENKRHENVLALLGLRQKSGYWFFHLPVQS